MTITRRDAPPVTPAAREAFDRAAPSPRASTLRAASGAPGTRRRPLRRGHPRPGASTRSATPRSPSAREAPDPGRVLVRIARPDGIELRVSVHTYEGKPYVRVAPWKRGDGETWWPVKGKGASLKVRELARVASALADAMDATDGDASGGAR